jgi:hypothetical protein
MAIILTVTMASTAIMVMARTTATCRRAIIKDKKPTHIETAEVDIAVQVMAIAQTGLTD